MEPYLWKTRPDGINVIHIGKTWFAHLDRLLTEDKNNETTLV